MYAFVNGDKLSRDALTVTHVASDRQAQSNHVYLFVLFFVFVVHLINVNRHYTGYKARAVSACQATGQVMTDCRLFADSSLQQWPRILLSYK